jgi:hypothetical protein
VCVACTNAKAQQKSVPQASEHIGCCFNRRLILGCLGEVSLIPARSGVRRLLRFFVICYLRLVFSIKFVRSDAAFRSCCRCRDKSEDLSTCRTVWRLGGSTSKARSSRLSFDAIRGSRSCWTGTWPDSLELTREFRNINEVMITGGDRRLDLLPDHTGQIFVGDRRSLPSGVEDSAERRRLRVLEVTGTA